MAHITRGKLQKFDLSRKGIKDLINEIDGLKQSVKGELQDGATLYVAEQAKQTVESHLKGSIASSVEVRQPENRGGRTRVTIANTNPNAVYWEYGTGINGYNHSYEDETGGRYRDWETDRKSTRLNSSHSAKSRMPSSA